MEGHSSRINEFKQFVKNHPKLIEDVRHSKRTWKETYEDWIVLGEDHEMWNDYRTNKKSKTTVNSPKGSAGKQKEDPMKHIISLLKNVDMNEVNQYVSQFNGALSNVQELLQQFQKYKPQQPQQNFQPYNQWSSNPYQQHR